MMVVDAGNGWLGDRAELTRWLGRARAPWAPLMAAERQFDALIEDNEDVPAAAAYDYLFDMANLAVHWLDNDPCPDIAIGRRFRAQMMSYRAVADTVRSSIVADDGDAMVAELRNLRTVIDRHVDAIGDGSETGYCCSRC